MTIIPRVTRWSAGLVAVGLGLSLAFAASAAETLRIAKPIGSSTVLNLVDVGIKAGIFEKQGLKLEIAIFPGAAKVQQAIAADAADIAFSGATDMALAAKGAPAKAIAPLINSADLVAVVAANSRFKSVEDLKGSVWMASARSSISGWLPAQIPVKMGWPASALDIRTGASPDASLALIKTGQIDAAPVDPATAALLEKSGDMRVIVRFADIVPGFYQYAIYASDKLRAARPEAVRAFLAGWLETLQYVKANRDETVKTLAALSNADPAIVGKVLDDTLPRLVMDGRFPPAALDVLRSSFVDMGLLDKQPDVAAIYTDEFLPRK